ncbi:MAG: hypothetical protein U9R23_03650 [Candidatus Cloacimonadota bacterium]|nr:hypothetical protein [Candidatus Cloacimonadota bacterium]
MYKDFILILIRIFKHNVYIMILRKILIIILLLPSVLLADDISDWHYKTYIENNTEMTTTFIKYDEDTKKHVKKFINKKKVKLITGNDQYIATTAPVKLVKKLKNKLSDKIEICGLRDDNTYLQEKRIDKLLLDWKSEHKGMLKGFCHVDSIYIVSVIFKHPETKRRYNVESFFTESNGEFSSWLPEGEYKISVETVKSYMASENQKKKILKDVNGPKIVKIREGEFPKLEFIPIIYLDEEAFIEYTAKQKEILVFIDIDNSPSALLLTERNGYSYPIEITEDYVTLFNTPMYASYFGSITYKTISEIKPYKEEGFYPYLYSFSQTIPYADYVKTFVKPDEKFEISGEVKIMNHEIESFELSFLSAKHQLTYIQTDSLGHFSAEVYSDIYAVTIVSLPRIKTDVKDVLVNSYKKNDFKLEFTIVDSIPARRCFPGDKVILPYRYNYFTKGFKDLNYNTIKPLDRLY